MCKRVGSSTEDGRHNQQLRQIAHKALDSLLDSVDGVPDSFGVLGIDVHFQNGYFRAVEESTSRTHKPKG